MPHSPQDQGRTQKKERKQPPATGCVDNGETQGRAWSGATSSPEPHHAADDPNVDEQLNHVDQRAPRHVPPAAVRGASPAPAPPIPAIDGGSSGPATPPNSGVIAQPAEGEPDGRPLQHDLTKPTRTSPCSRFATFLHIKSAGRTFAPKRTRHDFLAPLKIFDTSFDNFFFFPTRIMG